MKAPRTKAAGQKLRVWLDTNRPAPRTRERVIAERLLNYHDASAMFQAFAVRRIGEVELFAATLAAADHAAHELGRPTRKAECQALDRVQRALEELREAIAQSPLPPDWATGIELSAERLPQIMLSVGWRDLRSPIHEAFGYPLSVVEVLDIASNLLERHRKGMRPRVGMRRRAIPRVTVFVRHLWHELAARFEQPPADGVGHAASAVLALAAPLGAKEAREMGRAG